MAGAKSGSKSSANIPHKHLHSRISYLYQAATYFADNCSQRDDSNSSEVTRKESNKPSEHTEAEPTKTTSLSAASRRMLSQLRGVSLKSQIRLSPAIKHSICNRCEGLLVPGSSSSTYIENKSRGGKKPWADVLVTECKTCGSTTRIPIGAKRQARRKDRPVSISEPKENS